MVYDSGLKLRCVMFISRWKLRCMMYISQSKLRCVVFISCWKLRCMMYISQSKHRCVVFISGSYSECYSSWRCCRWNQCRYVNRTTWCSFDWLHSWNPVSHWIQIRNGKLQNSRPKKNVDCHVCYILGAGGILNVKH